MQLRQAVTVAPAAQLTELADAEDPYDYDPLDVRELQMLAADDRFQRARTQMRVLERRAEDGAVEAITAIGDLVPLMFSDATYKSYPDSFVAQGRWPALGAWLDALSTSGGAATLDYYPVRGAGGLPSHRQDGQRHSGQQP